MRPGMFKFLVGFAVTAVVAGGTVFVMQTEKASRYQYPEIDVTDRAAVREGRKLYGDFCASCHGARLEGEANWRQQRADGSLPAPPHDETGHTWHHPDQLLFAVTKYGGQVNAPEGFTSNMPAFKQDLTDGQIVSILAFIKSRWPDEVRQRQDRITEQFRKDKE